MLKKEKIVEKLTDGDVSKNWDTDRIIENRREYPP